MTLRGVVRQIPLALGALAFLGLSPEDSAVSPGPAAGVAEDSIGGTWVLNRDKSDDPMEEMQKAQQEAQEQAGGGRSRRGGAASGRRPPSKSTTGRQVSVSPEQRQRIRASMQQALRAAPQLTILQSDSTVTVSTGRGDRIYFTDSREVALPIGPDLDETIKAKMDKDKLVVEAETDAGVETRFEYERDGEQLKVKVRIQVARPRQVVRYELVYDPAR